MSPMRRALGVLGVVLLAASAGGAASSLFAQSPTPTPVVTPSPTPGDLVLDGRALELGGQHSYRRVVLKNRARLSVAPYDGRDTTGRLDLTADWIEIDATSAILGNAYGYRGFSRNNGEGPGGGEGGRNAIDGAGGGGHGGRGGDGVLDGQPQSGAQGGRSYGDDCSQSVDMGSAGGSPGTADNPGDSGSGSRGGAAVTLTGATVLITGTISVNGGDGDVVANDAAGGGAGGGILVRAQVLSQTGRLEARGGAGGDTDDGGGGGGGGRIKVFYGSGTVTRRTMRVDGGKGDGNGLPNDGRPGSICIEKLPATATPTATATDTATATATATPEVSDTPTPTATLTPSATATDTPSATPTATATATPTPADLYLPLTLRERCPPIDLVPLQMVVVIDASTSMLEPVPDGGSKLDAAKAAVAVPIELLSRPGDGIGLVTFNAAAETLAPITADQAQLLAALQEIVVRPGSRLDAGVRRGTEQLLRPETRPGLRRLVVLTDGLPNPSTPADALAAAEEAKAAGILVETIGLGADAAPLLLRAMATSPDRYYYAPDAATLEAIFHELTVLPDPCAKVPLWPGGERPTRGYASVAPAPGAASAR
jgi:hypothetical protein